MEKPRQWIIKMSPREPRDVHACLDVGGHFDNGYVLRVDSCIAIEEDNISQ